MALTRFYQIICLLSMFSFCVDNVCAEEFSMDATTIYGNVRGVRSENYDAFLGIPFAQPPVGELRWKDPQPPLAWSPETYQADTQPPGCIQICEEPYFACPLETSEDCLYLNIYRPSTTQTDGLLPVFVFLYGGNFHSGGCSALLYDGRFLAQVADAVLVIPNYRVGAMGFLKLEKDPITGEEVSSNFGLEDQLAALRFVKDNIEAFGGDPQKVTLAGQSAGAESIAVHMTSPQSSALFNQVILFSEPFALPLPTKKDSLALGLHFASLLSCQNDTLACLRSKAPSEIATATQESENFEINKEKELLRFQTWGPTVEEQPVRLFEAGLFQTKPIMLGTLTEEARLYVYGLFDKPVPSFLYMLFLTILVPDKGNAIIQQYPADDSNSDQREVISQLATDYIFSCPVLHVAKEIFERGQDDVYYYVFDQAVSADDAWDVYSWCNHHTCHSGDIPFFFGTPSLAGVEFTPKEKILTERFMRYIGNFIRSGNPNQGLETEMFSEDLTYWPSIGANWEVWSTLLMSAEDVHVEENLLENVCIFWDGMGYYGNPNVN